MTDFFKHPGIDQDFLRQYRFDEKQFLEISERIKAGTLSPRSSVFEGEIAAENSATELDWNNIEHTKLGIESLRSGNVALFVLNGGMATRFGNVVKGTVEVFDQKSFLQLKAEDVRDSQDDLGAEIPFVMMNSFATREATLTHFQDNHFFGLSEDDIYSYEQSISLRMNPDGTLYLDEKGTPSYHSPGHGDFFAGLRASGVMSALRDRGCKYILFSNVDNLGATIEPAIIGNHIASACSMTAELTERRKNSQGIWDKGGAPALANGRSQLLEGFRFPADFDRGLLPDFSTNNFIFTLEDIDRPLTLPRHIVEKNVNGSDVLQIESITCEVSGIYENGQQVINVNYLRVPREGARGRFFPVKSRQDLEDMRPLLKERLAAGRLLRQQTINANS